MILNKTPKAALASDEREPDLATTLRQSGLKVTPQRLAVARALAGDATHPTAQELFDRLRVAFPTMSFATVYNTLSALSSVGWVSPLAMGGATRFDPNTIPHHHAVCDSCGAVRDVPAGTHERTEPLSNDFEVRSIEVTYRGLCASCRPSGGDE